MPKSEQVKQNKVLEILTTEYPFERILMGVLGVIVTVLGVYLIQGDVLTITNTDAWWNAWLFGTDAGILGFSIFILVIGVVSFFVAIWPFFQPSFAEMKKVSWPNGKTIRNHSARVFGFIILLGLLFVIYDFGLQPLFDWLMSLGG
jgi:preprotein translocase subunit SecE